MKQKMHSEGVDVVYTVATAAYRTAKNRDEVIECIRREAGINVCILSKKEESVATNVCLRHIITLQVGNTKVKTFSDG
ncbi:MAG: hypothetical protein ACLSHL_09675 [Alistipes communis]